jgi:hypothetical protein
MILGACTRWFNDQALLVGWTVGIVVGTAMAAAVNPTYPLQFAGFTFPSHTALYTVILNIVEAIVLTPVFNALGAAAHTIRPYRRLRLPRVRWLRHLR